MKVFIKKILLATIVIGFVNISFAQEMDSVKQVRNFSGSVTLTNKGISTIPSFTLGKPAAVFTASLGNRLRFEPQFKFALNGKPWSFAFRWRYDLINANKTHLTIGTSYGISFKNIIDTCNGITNEYIKASRGLMGEIAPSFLLSKNISVGFNYLFAYRLSNDATKYIHYLTLNGNLSNIRLSDSFYIKLSPQIFYLKMGKYDGYYLAGTLTLSKKDFPFSVSSFGNKILQSNIPGSQDFIWNLSLTYSFRNTYKRL